MCACAYMIDGPLFGCASDCRFWRTLSIFAAEPHESTRLQTPLLPERPLRALPRLSVFLLDFSDVETDPRYVFPNRDRLVGTGATAAAAAGFRRFSRRLSRGSLRSIGSGGSGGDDGIDESSVPLADSASIHSRSSLIGTRTDTHYSAGSSSTDPRYGNGSGGGGSSSFASSGGGSSSSEFDAGVGGDGLGGGDGGVGGGGGVGGVGGGGAFPASDPDVTITDWKDEYLSTLDLSKPLYASNNVSVVCGRLRGDRLVAVKRIAAETLSLELIEERLQEGSLWSSLKHPNINEFVGVFVDPLAISLVSRLAAHGSLFDFLHER